MRRVFLSLMLYWIGTHGILIASEGDKPLHLQSNLQHLWSQRFGDTNDQYGYSGAFDPSGNVAMTGYFDGTVDFGGGTLTSAGSDDIFLVKFGPTVGVEEEGDFRLEIDDLRLELLQNHPNPFHSSTTIRYQIPLTPFNKGGKEGGFRVHVRLAIYDITGRLVETLINESQESGVYRVEWEGRGQPSEIYFYRLTTNEFDKSNRYNASKKLILLG